MINIFYSKSELYIKKILILDLYKFEDEQAVQKEADRLISKIFADKSYSNPEKLSLLLQDY